MAEKMMPGQKPYTPEERKKRDHLFRQSIQAEEIIPLDELEEYAMGAADKAFHEHLDSCKQCEEHPFDLCPEGAHLLREAGREMRLCPHGKKLGECQACDVAGDLAYDAAREDSRRNF
jgi:hypothetical protein